MITGALRRKLAHLSSRGKLKMWEVLEKSSKEPRKLDIGVLHTPDDLHLSPTFQKEKSFVREASNCRIAFKSDYHSSVLTGSPEIIKEIMTLVFHWVRQNKSLDTWLIMGTWLKL